MRELFEYEERTEHKGVVPARDRIRQFKTRAIGFNPSFTGKKPPTAAAGMRR
jgi:hypothetical protein